MHVYMTLHVVYIIYRMVMWSVNYIQPVGPLPLAQNALVFYYLHTPLLTCSYHFTHAVNFPDESSSSSCELIFEACFTVDIIHPLLFFSYPAKVIALSFSLIIGFCLVVAVCSFVLCACNKSKLKTLYQMWRSSKSQKWANTFLLILVFFNRHSTCYYGIAFWHTFISLHKFMLIMSRSHEVENPVELTNDMQAKQALGKTRALIRNGQYTYSGSRFLMVCPNLRRPN